MTEPTPERGESWEDMLMGLYVARNIVELAMATAEPWEVDELKARKSELWYAIECAEKHVAIDAQEIDW